MNLGSSWEEFAQNSLMWIESANKGKANLFLKIPAKIILLKNLEKLTYCGLNNEKWVDVSILQDLNAATSKSK